MQCVRHRQGASFRRRFTYTIHAEGDGVEQITTSSSSNSGSLLYVFWVIAGVLLSACGSEGADTDASASTLVESGSVEPEPVTPVLVEADTLTEVLLPCI